MQKAKHVFKQTFRRYGSKLPINKMQCCSLNIHTIFGQSLSKRSVLPSVRIVSLVLNILLTIVLILFALSSLRVYHLICSSGTLQKNSNMTSENQTSSIGNISMATDTNRKKIVEHSNKSVLIKETIDEYAPEFEKRYFYLDLGCFDSRDTDYFIHFHLKEVILTHYVQIIAFEGDPINFSACKFMLQRHKHLNTSAIQAAIWIEDGEVRYDIEKGSKSKIDPNSALVVPSIDFSQWLIKNIRLDDYVYVKFTTEGVEIPVLEKMVNDESITLVDHLEIEWTDWVSPSFEPRRVALECIFDSYGMDFLYMISSVDLRHAYNYKNSFATVPKEKGWKLKDSSIRFHYSARKDASEMPKSVLIKF